MQICRQTVISTSSRGYHPSERRRSKHAYDDNVINGFFDTKVSGGKELQFHLVEDSGAGRQQQAAAVA